MARNRAVFLDRDGVINDLVYNEEEGNIGSPLSAKHLRVFPYAGSSIRELQRMGFKVIVISNQPGVAKKQFSLAEHMKMKMKVERELAKSGAELDGEYYCMHHPAALLGKYRMVCDCRKPKPGLLLRAAKEHDIDLKNSYFVGDALVDVRAGRKAGCRTMLIGHVTDFLARMIEKECAEPDFMIGSLKDVPNILQSST